MSTITLSLLGTDLHSISQLIYYVMIVVYLIFSVILLYHWKSYGTEKSTYVLTSWIYFGTSLPLLLIMGFIVIFS
ncbi:hypothetical protein KC845_01280 [Candidatus Kaiserbacteria bacterium]|nr:hypothetical protein [Candidatus Kaiserbacteria bacterium]